MGNLGALHEGSTPSSSIMPDTDKWVERTCVVRVRECRDFEYKLKVQANRSEGEDLHENMHEALEMGDFGELIWESPEPQRQEVHEVSWFEEGAECTVVFNPPKEV